MSCLNYNSARFLLGFPWGSRATRLKEVVLGIGMKTLSNYTNHTADTPLDQAFGRAAWSKAA